MSFMQVPAFQEPESSIRVGESDQADWLHAVVIVQELQVVAEPQDIEATVDLERSTLPGDDGHAELETGVEESERVVARTAPRSSP